MSGPKYTPGQRVEVLAVDLTIPGWPAVWMTGTVTGVEPTHSGCWDVAVARDNGKLWVQEIGKRGGNNRIDAL